MRKGIEVSSADRLAIIAAVGIGRLNQRAERTVGIRYEDKTCPNCGEGHSHHNRYCSAKCCTEYRQKQRTP